MKKRVSLLLCSGLLVGCVPAEPVIESSPAAVVPACGFPRAGVELSTLTVIPSTASDLYIQWGQQNGCFAQQGLDVVLLPPSSAGAEKLASLVGGSADVSAEDLTDLVLSLANSGQDLKLLSGVYEYTDEQLELARQAVLKDGKLVLETALYAAPDNRFTGVDDFKGSRIGIAPGRGANTLALEKYLKDAGIALEEIEFVPLPPQERLEALRTNSLDFVILTGALGYEALDFGATLSLYPGAYLYEPGAVIVWFTTAEIAQTKEGELTAFRNAVLRIHSLLNEPERLGEFKGFLTRDYGLSDEATANFTMPTLVTRELSTEEFDYIVDFLSSQGSIDSGFTLDESVLFSPVR